MFSEKLKEVRTAKGLTQYELSESAGVPLSSLRGYEQGKRQPTWDVVVALAKALGVPTDAFRDEEK